MKQPHKHAALIKAWADGARIEVYWNGEWEEIANPVWNDTCQYRVKPEPKPDVAHDIRVWVSGHANEKVILHLYNSETHKANKANLRLTFDGETGKLKKAEVLE